MADPSKSLKDMTKAELEERLARMFAEDLVELLENRDKLTAADRNVIRQYLKDNNIQINKGTDKNFDKIVKDAEDGNLPFKVPA